jgi:hypothetical protein
LSVPSNTLTALDRLSAPGSSPPIPFRAARTPFGVRCRHFDSATRTACCRSEDWQLPGHFMACTRLTTVFGTFHDSRTESVVFQAVFRWWGSGSRPQLLDSFPLPRGYLPAPSPGARRMNADPRSAFRLSPLREPPPVPGQVGLTSGRHHGRVRFRLSRINRRSWLQVPRRRVELLSADRKSVVLGR